MRIARFIDVHGHTLTGKLIDAETAVPIRGELLGAHEFRGDPVRVSRLLAPVNPPNIIAIGLNYRKHAEEQGLAKLPIEPLIFLKATSSLCGPGDEIVLPASAPAEVDYEAELAIVIGRRGRNVSEADALGLVLGFACANDVSARDCQKVRDKQWARGKSFDTFCPLGPAIVTPDEVDGQNAGIRATLNGRVMQSSNTSDMIFSIRQIISFVSHQFTLLPGTVILTGTPEGVGFARKPPVYLRAGDTIAIEIDGVGRMENRVVADASAA